MNCLRFSLSIFFTCISANIFGQPTPSPTNEAWVAPSESQIEASRAQLERLSLQNPDEFAKTVSTISPGMAAVLGYKGYKFSIKGRTEMENRLWSEGLTTETAKPASKALNFVGRRTWFKGGLWAISVYETYVQFEPLFNRPKPGVVPIHSTGTDIPAFRWRMGAAIFAAIAFGLYYFLHSRRKVR
jgi:hypothetical protein